MFFKSVLIASLFVFYSINICDAIKCYSCSSLVYPNCGDAFQVKEEFKKDCDKELKPNDVVDPAQEKPNKCSVFSYLDTSGNKITERHCFWESKSKPSQCYKGPVQTNPVECKSCDSEYCNSAPKMLTTTTISVTLLMTIIIAFLMS